MKTEAPEISNIILLIARLVPEHIPTGEVPPLGVDTALFGLDGILDSTGLVSLVVALEQAIQDEFGLDVSLADDRALSQKNSPYRTIGSLAEYAISLCKAGS